MARPVVVRLRTRRQVERLIIPLVGMLASIQIAPDAIEPFARQGTMLTLRILVALIVAAATMRFEMYKAKQQRL